MEQCCKCLWSGLHAGCLVDSVASSKPHSLQPGHPERLRTHLQTAADGIVAHSLSFQTNDHALYTLKLLLLCVCLCLCARTKPSPVPAVTPPGYYTANGRTQPCPDASFREGWLPAAEAGSCTSCGVNVLADKTDRVTVYDIVTGNPQELAVTTSAQDCCECLCGRNSWQFVAVKAVKSTWRHPA